MLQGCSNKSDTNRDITRMLQGCSNKSDTVMIQQECYTHADNLGQAVRTQLADGLLADLLFTRKNIVASLPTAVNKLCSHCLSCQQVWNKLLTT
jgi:hypothetical protein